MMPRRVVITGIGQISPHGQDPNAAFDAMLRGESAIRSWNTDDAAPTVTAVAATAAFDPGPWFTRVQLSGVDRVSQFAVAAAELARQDASLTSFTDPERAGIYFGTGLGGATAIENGFSGYFQNNRRVPPSSIVAIMCNAAASHIAIRQQILGPVMTYSVACASSGLALGEAYRAIQHGRIDVALAGGAEAMLNPGTFRFWQAMQVLATPDPTDATLSCKPFSSHRSGMVLGEGAAVLVLESLDQAQARGARIYAELCGYGTACDAHHIFKPQMNGQIRTMTAALREAGIGPADIAYCNAHGTATALGDLAEATALRQVWGDHLPALRVGSTKSMHGHLLGGTGALETAITALAVYRRQLPAHLSSATMDAECALPLIGDQGEDAPHLQAAISNSFAFGGTNVSLVLRRVDQ